MSKKKKPAKEPAAADRGARPAAPPGPISTERIALVALFLGFWVVYYLSIGVDRPNLAWPNFLFDADPARVLDDALNGQNPAVFARHPLFALTIGSIASAFASVLDPPAAVLAATSLLAALGVAASLIVFRRLCGQLLPALLFSLLYGFSAAPWLLASIPETFTVNSTFIVGVFLIHRPAWAQPERHRLRFGLNALWTALAMGVAVPNIVYPALGFASNLRTAQKTLLRRATVYLLFVAATCGAFVLLGWVQRAAFPGKVFQAAGLSAPFRAAGNDSYLKLDRPFIPAEAGHLLRAFGADNVVAPPARIVTGRVPDGPLSLIQYGGPVSPRYMVACAALLALVGILLWKGKPREAIREHSVQLALAFLTYNLVFHYFYRANGQPLIFTTHAVFPMLVVVAALSRGWEFRFRTPLLGVSVLLVIVNNGSLVGFVREALNLPCDRQVGVVCLAWPGHAADPRYTEGIATFQTSADYPMELARVEYNLGRFEESIPLFRKALELDGGYLLPRLYLGDALMRVGRFDEAIGQLHQSLERFPAEPKLQNLLNEARRQRALLPPDQAQPR